MGDYPGLPSGSNHKGPYEREAVGPSQSCNVMREAERQTGRGFTTDSEVGEGGHEPRNAGGL